MNLFSAIVTLLPLAGSASAVPAARTVPVEPSLQADTTALTIAPVTVSMSLKHGGDYTLAGDGIIPIAMGGPFPQYTITGFEGSIDKEGETFTFSMTCGTHPVTFAGRRPMPE